VTGTQKLVRFVAAIVLASSCCLGQEPSPFGSQFPNLDSMARGEWWKADNPPLMIPRDQVIGFSLYTVQDQTLATALRRSESTPRAKIWPFSPLEQKNERGADVFARFFACFLGKSGRSGGIGIFSSVHIDVSYFPTKLQGMWPNCSLCRPPAWLGNLPHDDTSRFVNNCGLIGANHENDDILDSANCHHPVSGNLFHGAS